MLRNPPDEIDLAFRYTADSSLNARVRSQGHRHEVYLHIALPTLIHYACNLIVSFPDLFPNIGDVTRQAGVEPIHRIPMTLPEASPEAIEYILGVSRPVDDHRALLATFLAEIAISFCVFHEVAHIVCGHTASLPGALVEFDGDGSSAFPTNVSEFLEFEADIHAGYMLASSLLHHDNQARYERLFQPQQDSQKQSVAIETMVTALFVLFSVLDQRNTISRNHPPPITRLLSVIDELRNSESTMVAANRGLEPAEMDRALFESLNATHQVWQALGLPGFGDDVDYTVRIAREHQLILQTGLEQARQSTSNNAWGISTLTR